MRHASYRNHHAYNPVTQVMSRCVAAICLLPTIQGPTLDSSQLVKAPRTFRWNRRTPLALLRKAPCSCAGKLCTNQILTSHRRLDLRVATWLISETLGNLMSLPTPVQTWNTPEGGPTKSVTLGSQDPPPSSPSASMFVNSSVLCAQSPGPPSPTATAALQLKDILTGSFFLFFYPDPGAPPTPPPLGVFSFFQLVFCCTLAAMKR